MKYNCETTVLHVVTILGALTLGRWLVTNACTRKWLLMCLLSSASGGGVDWEGMGLAERGRKSFL
jgi:hypothetical protein